MRMKFILRTHGARQTGIFEVNVSEGKVPLTINHFRSIRAERRKRSSCGSHFELGCQRFSSSQMMSTVFENARCGGEAERTLHRLEKLVEKECCPDESYAAGRSPRSSTK